MVIVDDSIKLQSYSLLMSIFELRSFYLDGLFKFSDDLWVIGS